MKTITFTTNGSHRLTARIKSVLPGSYCHNAGLRTKRKAFTAYIGDEKEVPAIIEKLKSFKVSNLMVDGVKNNLKKS